MRVLLVVVAVGVILVMVLWSLQRRLVYLPEGSPPPVERVLPGAREVAYGSAGGLERHGWWLPGGPTAVVVLPGNAGHRGLRAPLATALRDLGLSVLLVDYRGYGGNPGSPSEAGLLADGRAAVAWTHDRPEIDDVVLFGESLGAAVAVAVAAEDPPAALILRSPFTSLVDMARTVFGPVPAFLLRDRFPSIDRIGAVRAPLLVVAAGADEIVPHDQSRRLHAAAAEPKRFVTVRGAGHNDPALLDGDVLVEAVRTLLADHGLLP